MWGDKGTLHFCKVISCFLVPCKQKYFVVRFGNNIDRSFAKLRKLTNLFIKVACLIMFTFFLKHSFNSYYLKVAGI